MPSIQLGEVFANLPEMRTFRVDNVDDFTQEQLAVVCNKLQTFQGLEHLGFELVVFDLYENRELLLSILKLHSGSLTKLSFAKNKVSNEFMQFVCEGLQGLSKLE